MESEPSSSGILYSDISESSFISLISSSFISIFPMVLFLIASPVNAATMPLRSPTSPAFSLLFISPFSFIFAIASFLRSLMVLMSKSLKLSGAFISASERSSIVSLIRYSFNSSRCFLSTFALTLIKFSIASGNFPSFIRALASSI